MVNNYIQQREEHRLMCKSGGRNTQVDYILYRRCNLNEIGSCKVVTGENLARQHQMFSDNSGGEEKEESRGSNDGS